MSSGAKYVQPGAGHCYRILGGDEVYVKASAEDTGGRYTVFETTVPPQGGPPPHVHHREEETFYVLEGQFEFKVGDQLVSAGTGAFLIAPKDVPHTFRNVGATPGRLIIMITPGGFERFIEEFATLPTDRPPDVVKMAEMGARHGLEFLLSAPL